MHQLYNLYTIIRYQEPLLKFMIVAIFLVEKWFTDKTHILTTYIPRYTQKLKMILINHIFTVLRT